MRLSTTEEMAEWYRQDVGKEPAADMIELLKHFIWLCEGLEELGNADSSCGRPALGSSVFQQLLKDMVTGNSVFAKEFRTTWSETAQMYYMRGYNRSTVSVSA